MTSSETRPEDLFHEPTGVAAYNPYEDLDRHDQQVKDAHEAIRWLVRNALENYPPEQRTGCLVGILHTVAEVLVSERGWTPRQAADALVLEGVRAGGEIERGGVRRGGGS